MRKICQLMKNARLLVLVLILLTAMVLSGCQNYQEGWTPYDPLALAEKQPESAPATTEPGTTSGQAPFLIWGETDTQSLNTFKLRHPQLDVHYRERNAANWELEWIAALAAGTGPDVFVYGAEHAGWAAMLDVFEDLSSADYSFNNLKPLLSEAEWEETLSFDRKKHVHLPIYTYPGMLFYRADILEENGFPSDPKALSDYLSSPVHWLEMVRKLHANGHAVIEWNESPWNIGGFLAVPFTTDIEWRMKQEPYSTILHTGVAATRENLVGNVNIWVESGRQSLRSGQLVMMQMGAWGVDLLPEWVPEQSGEWRVTRLPMGMSAEWGTRWMSMNQAGKNKALAWEFMELTTRSVRSYYASLQSVAYPYFGGQRVYELANQMQLEMPPLLRTPVDRQIAELFWNQLYLIYDGNMPSDDFLEYLDREIESRFGLELSVLREIRVIE